MDTEGAALSAQVLGAYLEFGGVEYLFGTPNQNDVILGGTSEAITLPAGNFGTLHVLALAVNGAQLQQAFTVTYTDGTSKTFLQSLSDWYTPQSFPGEAIAVASPYRDLNSGAEDDRTVNLYAYTFNLNSAKTVKSLTMPANTSVAVYAMTLGK